MTIEFLKEAEDELFDIVLWYEAKRVGLGKRFRDVIAQVTARIVEFPFRWSERSGGYRRVNCPVFPYYVAYFIRGEKIVIAAVAHARRDPDYWKHRIP